MKLSNVKTSSRIVIYSASAFLILKRFDHHNKVILFIVIIFVASCQTGGAKPKTGGVIPPLLQHRIALPVSIVSSLWRGCFTCLQVRVDQLMSYLFEMKSRGYTLIGAEQTVNGQSLRHFQFPKKTVLILGYDCLYMKLSYCCDSRSYCIRRMVYRALAGPWKSLIFTARC